MNNYPLLPMNGRIKLYHAQYRNKNLNKVLLPVLFCLLLMVHYCTNFVLNIQTSPSSLSIPSSSSIRREIENLRRRESNHAPLLSITTTTTDANSEEIIHINPKGGSDSNGCSSNPTIGCKTISYSIDDLKNSRGILNINRLVLKFQSSIDDSTTKLETNQNCGGFSFSGISFSELKITSSDEYHIVTIDCNGSSVSNWISNSNFNLTLSNIKWSNFVIPQVKLMESISIEGCEIQNMTISMANSVNIRNCKVTSNGYYFSLLQLNDVTSISVIQTSFERMTVGKVISKSSSKVFMDNINVENGVLIFYGNIASYDVNSIQNSLTMVNSNFTASTVRIIEFSTIVFKNNNHNQNIPYIPAVVSNFFSEYSYSSFSVTSLQVRSDMEVRNISVQNMAKFGGALLEGPGLYALFYDSIFQNNGNSLGGAAIHIRTVFRVSLQNVNFISNTVDSITGKIDLEYIGGGAIYQYRSVLITMGCYFYNNSAVFGGGIFSYLPLEYFSVEDNFVANRASYGGAYASMDTISVSQIYFSETNMTFNNATSSGGAIFTMQSKITLSYGKESNAIISGNRANMLGGGIYFLSSTAILKFRELANIFTDNYSKTSPRSSEYSSFATTVSTSPSDFKLKPGKTENVFFNFIDMFGNRVPYTTNMRITLSSSKEIYPEIIQPAANGFGEAFGFSVYLTRQSFIMYNTTVNIILGLTNIPYEKSLSFNVQLTACAADEMLNPNVFKKSAIGTNVYECGPNLYLVGVMSVISIVIAIVACFICCTFVIYKFYRMKGKVKLLAKKELAEEELTKKLIDLQTLYNSELENKHCYKEWLIKLEDVELIKKVGEGGGGIVYLANWKRVPVALKTIKLNDEDLDSNDFEHEASLLSSIRHPNVVTFYGVCLSDQSKFMVTEFMHGGSLDSFIYALKIRKKSISFPQKIQILSNIASGMSYLHDRCIMHRDLKPGNILLANDLTAKITDFGLSKLYSTDSDSMTKTCTVGTLLYMAPEVLLGTKYDEKCDVYSYSIIMWQVLFEESSLFNSSYIDNPKYSSIMTETQKQTFKNLNEAYMIIPKMVSEGLRLPLPSLPLSDHYVDYWVNADCGGDRKMNVTLKESYSFALDGIFRLIEECWNADVSQRPSFTSIVDKLVELEKALQKVVM